MRAGTKFAGRLGARPAGPPGSRWGAASVMTSCGRSKELVPRRVAFWVLYGEIALSERGFEEGRGRAEGRAFPCAFGLPERIGFFGVTLHHRIMLVSADFPALQRSRRGFIRR